MISQQETGEMQRSRSKTTSATASRAEEARWTPAMVLAGGVLLTGLVWLLAIGPAAGQGIERLGDFGKWQAYAFDENGAKACYIASRPTKDEGNYTSRGQIYAMVTHRPAEETRDVVSLAAGYTFQEQSNVRVSIDGKTFDLAAVEDTAWAPDTTGDQKLVAAMKAGSTMVVKGTSSRGTATTDTYSLMGFSKAYQTAARACGY